MAVFHATAMNVGFQLELLPFQRSGKTLRGRFRRGFPVGLQLLMRLFVVNSRQHFSRKVVFFEWASSAPRSEPSH
jgi:hypothetical protein